MDTEAEQDVVTVLCWNVEHNGHDLKDGSDHRRRLPSRERRAFQLLLNAGAIWPTSGVDRSTVRRLQTKGLPQLVTFDRTSWVGELSDRYGTPWATVRLPTPPSAAPATAEDVAAMERAERDQAMFEAKRHNGDHGYDYAPVLSETGALIGWRYRSTLGGHGWTTVDGQLCPENVESGEEAQEQARAAHHAGAVASVVIDAARRLHPTAHLFRPMRSTTAAEGAEEVLD